MALRVQHTQDGSVTLLNTVVNATYHSRYGAMQESKHIYIEQGLKQVIKLFDSPLQVFEMGFGTGLNAWLTWQEAKQHALHINYAAVEKYPVPPELYPELNYAEEGPGREAFQRLLHLPWQQPVTVDPFFTLAKFKTDINDFIFPEPLHLVYYDAFDPQAAPDCWSPALFEKLFTAMARGACLVTFCAKGDVKRLLKQIGFKVENPEGPFGKREITRALKPIN